MSQTRRCSFSNSAAVLLCRAIGDVAPAVADRVADGRSETLANPTLLRCCASTGERRSALGDDPLAQKTVLRTDNDANDAKRLGGSVMLDAISHLLA